MLSKNDAPVSLSNEVRGCGLGLFSRRPRYGPMPKKPSAKDEAINGKAQIFCCFDAGSNRLPNTVGKMPKKKNSVTKTGDRVPSKGVNMAVLRIWADAASASAEI